MENRMKVATILGTRPEIIRLSACIKACDRYFNHILIHTGQNWDYTLNEVFFQELGLREPDYYLNSVGAHLGESMGNIIAKSYEILSRERPDAVLILGDTNSALSAISAKRLKIPIFHMEAGNRCWDWNVPEMVNRTIVDHISDINLPYTEHSRRYLLGEGIDGKTIFVTGSPMPEVLQAHRKQIESSTVLNQLSLTPRGYLLVSAHREGNIDHEAHFLDLMNAINDMAEKYHMPVIYSTHPRSMKFIEKRQAENGFSFHPLVRSLKPFGFFDYNQLQRNSFCVLSDSGTLSEESALLHFPAVLIRTSTERPEVLDRGSIVIGGIKSRDVEQAVTLAVELFRQEERPRLPEDYMDINVSAKIVKLIQSYAKIVKQTVWLES